jgi:diaminopropionate ammonia-lyase
MALSMADPVAPHSPSRSRLRRATNARRRSWWRIGDVSEPTGRVEINPGWTPAGADGTGAVGADAATIRAFHASLPGLAATPLVDLPDVARELGVARVVAKHERERLGLPSFKVIGASWAVACALAQRAGAAAPPTSFSELEDLAARLPEGTTLTTATDGNHGRAVAHMAKLLGLPSRITVPAGTVAARVEAIASEGANVRVSDGDYDAAVREVAAEAGADPSHVLVSDTSWPGYEAIPRRVVDGYSTIFAEVHEQLGDDARVDVAFVPAGVGAFAAAAVAGLHPRGAAVVTVEPDVADCVRRSLVAGEPVVVPGPHRSIMAGLNCGEVSRIAWPALRDGIRAAVAVSDDEVVAAMRTLDAAGLPTGESGAASLAGARATAGHPLLTPDATVLLLLTEAVTDPEAYAQLVAVRRLP